MTMTCTRGRASRTRGMRFQGTLSPMTMRPDWPSRACGVGFTEIVTMVGIAERQRRPVRARERQAADDLGEEGIREVGDDDAHGMAFRLLRPRANWLGWYPMSSTARWTRARVASVTQSAPLTTAETVAIDTSHRWAMSWSVVCRAADTRVGEGLVTVGLKRLSAALTFKLIRLRVYPFAPETWHFALYRNELPQPARL